MIALRTWRCPGCSRAVTYILVDGHQIALDSSQRVFSRLRDPETGQEFWLEDRAPKGETRNIFAEHICQGDKP
jgi:hypothetical protein